MTNKEMTKENIRNNTYPYTTEVYVAVRSDINRNSKAYELFEFLTTPAGQDIIYESGYVPLNQESGISDICKDDGVIISTMYADLIDTEKMSLLATICSINKYVFMSGSYLSSYDS